MSAGANPHQREPRPGYREPRKSGPHLQPLSVPGRVTSSSNTESITGSEEVAALVSVAAARRAPHAVATRRAPQVPAPSNPALVRTPAAPLEFKPQPPPSFPALLPTERGGVTEERAVKPTSWGPKPGRAARAGAILTKGRASALGPASLTREGPAAIFCEGIEAEARAAAIFVEGESRPWSVNLSGS